MARQALLDLGADLHGELPGHAGFFETSVMAALFPEHVSLEQAPVHDFDPTKIAPPVAYRHGKPGRFRAPNGYSDNPAAASAEWGQRLLAACVEQVAEQVRAFVERQG